MDISRIDCLRTRKSRGVTSMSLKKDTQQRHADIVVTKNTLEATRHSNVQNATHSWIETTMEQET